MIEKFLEFIGGVGVETFCFGALYEPTIPEELRSIDKTEK
ncbi:cyclic lactone autoinducer peptide [Enterococcus plantarum]|nr:cyclic lactone autoinducer peptide [Enterococcus plantarum]MBO0423214.1 cyclic lactone autoinducer peptide [Enterococcus plantarum]